MLAPPSSLQLASALVETEDLTRAAYDAIASILVMQTNPAADEQGRGGGLTA